MNVSCATSVSPPPNGITSNFVNPPSLEAATLATDGILGAFSIIFTAIRLHANARRLATADCESQIPVTIPLICDGEVDL